MHISLSECALMPSEFLRSTGGSPSKFTERLIVCTLTTVNKSSVRNTVCS